MGQWDEVERKLRSVAGMITTRPVDEWAGAVTYILVCLDRRSRDEEFQRVLTDLRARIDVRLSRGRWSG
jgi:hypothetical protein